MSDESERSIVPAIDVTKFAREVDAMRGALEAALQGGSDRAGRAIEANLLRAVRTGKLGFDDLKKTALSALAEIAGAALKSAIGGGRGSSAAGLGSLLATVLGGAPGRATGGPVSPQRPYWVGERGPELFVPTTSGRIEAGASGSGGGARTVNIAIRVQAEAGAAPDALARSGRQVARAVRTALAAGE